MTKNDVKRLNEYMYSADQHDVLLIARTLKYATGGEYDVLNRRVIYTDGKTVHDAYANIA